MKADDKVVFEENEPEKFTNFELLQTEVEVLKETLNELVQIIDYNNLDRKKTIEPQFFNDDEVFERLNKED